MSKKQELKKKPLPVRKVPAQGLIHFYRMPLVCMMLACLAFIPVFKADFVNWDDMDYAYNNQTIQSLSNFKEIVTERVQGNYHPLTMLTLALNYAISGNDATLYHVVNLLLHLMNVLLVFVFIFQLSGKKPWTAFITALLFAIHPLHVESVAWVSERKDVLYSFFFMAGLIAYLNFLEKRTLLRLSAVFGLFILSLLSKPAAIVFPVVLIVIDYYYNRLNEPRSYIEKIPFFLVAVIFGLLTLNGQPITGEVSDTLMIPSHFKFFFGFYGIMMYILMAIVPVNLCAFYPYPVVNEALPIIYYISPLMTLILVILIITGFRKNRLITFAILFYLVNLALVLQFYPNGSAIIADRYTYIPMIGLFLAAGHYFQKWADAHSGKPTPLAFTILILVSLILTILTFQQASTWKNSAVLWDQAISVVPSSKAYTNLGLIYKIDKQKSKALEMFTRAIEINKAEKDAMINRGDIYFSQKKFDLAIFDYNQCLAIYPNEQLPIQNRGAAYAATGKYDLALADMNLSLTLNPNSINGYANRALLKQAINQNQAAIDDFYTHMKITPDTTGDIWNSIGFSYLRLNENEKALECFNRAIKLSNNKVFLNNREYVLSKLSKR
ncbi:MAG: tetratricopeptide repeat protein [Bacteroidota bacterium]